MKQITPFIVFEGLRFSEKERFVEDTSFKSCSQKEKFPFHPKSNIFITSYYYFTPRTSRTEKIEKKDCLNIEEVGPLLV